MHVSVIIGRKPPGEGWLQDGVTCKSNPAQQWREFLAWAESLPKIWKTWGCSLTGLGHLSGKKRLIFFSLHCNPTRIPERDILEFCMGIHNGRAVCALATKREWLERKEESIVANHPRLDPVESPGL